MQECVVDKGFLFYYLMDEGQKIYLQYGVSCIFEIYLIDVDGVLCYYGVIDDNVQDVFVVMVNYVEKVVEVLENG